MRNPALVSSINSHIQALYMEIFMYKTLSPFSADRHIRVRNTNDVTHTHRQARTNYNDVVHSDLVVLVVILGVTVRVKHSVQV